MGLAVIKEPASEPITLAEAKTQLRVDADMTLDDDYITGLVVAARRFVELRTRRSLIYTLWRYTLDRFPLANDFADQNWLSYNGAALDLPRSPVSFVVANTLTGIAYDTPRVTYTASDGSSAEAIRGTTWEDDFYSLPPRLVLLPSKYWPLTQVGKAMPVSVDFVAGYGPTASDVPAEFKHAVKILVEHWYRFRGTVGTVTETISFTLDALLGVCHDGSHP